ncbi:3708_t:CDS:2 [Paraglomus occultum]|uniref:3708_t:CDS:1 n=1 Tax=Paraglomus occultum TaxID=144539 RepID=A0A9N9ANV1_9GLOM|nr:3708_t:CDS:2 [Paraglomus occultum]
MTTETPSSPPLSTPPPSPPFPRFPQTVASYIWIDSICINVRSNICVHDICLRPLSSESIIRRCSGNNCTNSFLLLRMSLNDSKIEWPECHIAQCLLHKPDWTKVSKLASQVFEDAKIKSFFAKLRSNVEAKWSKYAEKFVHVNPGLQRRRQQNQSQIQKVKRQRSSKVKVVNEINENSEDDMKRANELMKRINSESKTNKVDEGVAAARYNKNQDKLHQQDKQLQQLYRPYPHQSNFQLHGINENNTFNNNAFQDNTRTRILSSADVSGIWSPRPFHELSYVVHRPPLYQPSNSHYGHVTSPIRPPAQILDNRTTTYEQILLPTLPSFYHPINFVTGLRHTI